MEIEYDDGKEARAKQLEDLVAKGYEIKNVGTFFWLEKDGKQRTSKVGSKEELESMASEISGVIPDVLE